MNTQIFATMGPACETEAIIKDMIETGMTGMRLNLSHTTLPASKSYIDAYRSAASRTNTVPQILIDMQGPELRVGDMKAPLELIAGEEVRFCADNLHWGQIPIPTPVLGTLEVGDEVLLDDGKLLVRVLMVELDERFKNEPKVGEQSKTPQVVTARVLRGGVLKPHKSIKIVNKDVQMPVLTAHDIDNIRCAKEYGVTALMQPFVRDGANLREVRQILKEHNASEIQIFAKIENRLGVENMDSIIPEADVIVIARGDLGNDMPLWELPRVQKQIEAACKKHNKPYIVVTQMLASMEQNPVPTRAEVSDIFHAVYHGAWGVMVTGETAVGKYPVEVIKYLTNTAKAAV